MRGLDLPHRRYSMPETIMRKFRLGQSSSSSDSSRSSTRQRRHVPRRKQQQQQQKLNKSVQTSPKYQSETCLEDQSKLLLDSSPSLLMSRRSISVPDLSSSEESRSNSKFGRAVSASDQFCGTPSPFQVSCYGGPNHTCALCSNSWSLTSSDYTLTQTVSDRTTSTQDSTLSVKSTSPSTPTPMSFSPEQALLLERNIFQPAGNFIAIHTESILIQPIDVVESSDHWHYGFSADDVETRMLMAPQNVGTITEDDIEAITSGRKDRSTSIGEWPKPIEITTHQEFSHIETMTDQNTNDQENVHTKDVGTQALESQATTNIASQTMNGNTAIGDHRKPEATGPPRVRCLDAGVLTSKIEELDYQRTMGVDFIDLERGRRDNNWSCRIQKTQFNASLRGSKSFPPHYRGMKRPRVDADVSVAGGNYKDLEEADSVIARYSAVPRSNSMVVNTSSVDYSSDSDLSLTDSLEDSVDGQGEKDFENRTSRHDNRLVRGEVGLEVDPRNRKRFPKSGDAYAYFLSMTGEQDLIKGCKVPEWLRARLKRREEEIKKLFEVKLRQHHTSQTIVYRRRKRMVRAVASCSSNKTLRWDDRRREDRPPHMIVGVVHEVPPRRLEAGTTTKKDVDDKKDVAEPSLERANSSQSLQPINTDNLNKYLHISEVIKIEMSNQLKTVVTKEKQINLHHDAFLHDGKSIQTSEIINNEDAHNSQKIIMRTNVGNFEIAQNATLMDSQPSSVVIKEPVAEVEAEAGTQTAPEHRMCGRSLLARPPDGAYSFKQFRPLFRSKADDQTVADVLLSAMNDDQIGSRSGKVSVHQQTEESSEEDAPGKVSVRQQTGESTSEDERVETVETSCNTVTTVETSCNTVGTAEASCNTMDTIETSCNTDQPYLSESVQTRESFLESQNVDEPVSNTADKSGQCDEASIDHIPTEILQTENKECNTDAFSVSALVQTKDTFDEHQTSFIEAEKDEITVISQLSKDRGTDVFEEEIDETTADKSCNTANSLATCAVQTDTLSSANEADKFESKSVSKKKDVQFDGSRTRQTSKNSKKGISRQKRDTPTPYCTRSMPDENKQVLELNVPPCTCHMCTFHKKAHPAPERQKDGIGSSRDKLAGRRNAEATVLNTTKDVRKMPKFSTGRRGVPGKFQRRFEAIPEEKGGLTDSIPEEATIDDESTKKLVTTGTMTRDPVRHVSIQEPISDDRVDDMTQTVALSDDAQKKVVQVSCKKSNVVIGRFRAIPDDQPEEGESSSELGQLPEGLEVVRQYKGRAALATNSSTTGQEELLTLSKGWINFYLLNDNNDIDDPHHDQGFHVEGADESVQEYTLEIQATPEPDFTPQSSTQQARQGRVTILPDLPQRDFKRSRRGKGSQHGNRSAPVQVILPDIHSSSSSSTPENCESRHSHHHNSSRKYHRHTLPDVNDARSSRNEIKARRERREQVTAISKAEPIFKSPAEMDHNLDASHSTKAVEVARSEHSVSSITSSTVILSESPSPQQLHFSDKKVQKRSAMYTEHNGIGASSWTVTVAGSSGVTNSTPPDVEMRLTFAKPNGQTRQQQQHEDNNNSRLMQYNSHQTHHISRSKRQGKMIEEYKHCLRNERHSLQYVPELRASKKERDSSQRDHYDEELSSQMSHRSKRSEGLSEEGELQVTGLAITPELKPRVPTQSERDLVRRTHYKFTR